jgi:hypothetical protein
MDIEPQEKDMTGTQSTDTFYTQGPKQAQSTKLTTWEGTLAEEPYDVPALRHKIDRHIVPIMFLCYLMNFIDKVALNVSITIQHLWFCGDTDLVRSMQRSWASTKTSSSKGTSFLTQRLSSLLHISSPRSLLVSIFIAQRSVPTDLGSSAQCTS